MLYLSKRCKYTILYNLKNMRFDLSEQSHSKERLSGKLQTLSGKCPEYESLRTGIKDKSHIIVQVH